MVRDDCVHNWIEEGKDVCALKHTCCPDNCKDFTPCSDKVGIEGIRY